MVSISDHMNAYTKLFADLENVDEKLPYEEKPLILLTSLPDDECEIFMIILINVKSSLSYNEIITAHVNY